MATPVNPQYQLELYQEFERHLPARWFKQLANQDGALYPLVWGLCGAMATCRESIEAARGQAIALESEGFWLSLHLLGLGLTRRGGETDEQARTRYRFEFSQTRNTRQGLLQQLEAHSGLTPPEVRLETAFAKGLRGELTLVVDTEQSWVDLEWWWLRTFFTEWVANGLSAKASLNTGGLRTVAFRPWDFYTRFPTGPDLLRPFWERPAFLNELRIFEFEQQFQARTQVNLDQNFIFSSTSTYSLPAADSWSLPINIAPFTLVPSALTDNPVSRNVLGFVCVENWDIEALRIAEIWRALAATQQPGRAFIYLGDDESCQTLEISGLPLPAPPFPEDDPVEILGYGPWRLRLGQGDDPLATTIAAPVVTLSQSGQWWVGEDGDRGQMPQPDGLGSVQLQLEFLLEHRPEPFYLSEIELTLGYEQRQFNTIMGWSLPEATSWLVPLAGNFELLNGTDPLALTPNLPSLSAVHYRRVDLWIPPEVNLGILFDIVTEPAA